MDLNFIDVKKVAIILSTFNGESYIVQLLESLSRQTHPFFSLYVRDDGSTDRTVALIESYAHAMDIDLYLGSHIGVVDSFFKLLSHVSKLSDIDYIAFCDQDDIWKEDKIERAVTALAKIKFIPALYFADYDIVRADLELIKVSAANLTINPKPSFANALVQNIVPGFTAVINKEAAVMISKHRPCSDKIIMHDWWVYLVVSAFGTVISDSKSTALYRRHGNNTMDANISPLLFWKNRINRYFLQKTHLYPLTIHAQEFKRCFMALMDDNIRAILDCFLVASTGTICDRIRYVIHGETYFRTRFDNFLFNLLMLFEIRR